MPEAMLLVGDAGTVLRTLPEKSVHCVVTSPPYHRLRDYGVDGQIGLENLHDCLGWATGNPCGQCYICKIVAVFREVWRVNGLDRNGAATGQALRWAPDQPVASQRYVEMAADQNESDLAAPKISKLDIFEIWRE